MQACLGHFRVERGRGMVHPHSGRRVITDFGQGCANYVHNVARIVAFGIYLDNRTSSISPCPDCHTICHGRE